VLPFCYKINQQDFVEIHINFDNILYIASKSLVSIVCGGFNGYILDKMIRDLFLLCAFFGIISIKYGIHI
jgi:hypothetical protein